jgi:hypothetical protein
LAEEQEAESEQEPVVLEIRQQREGARAQAQGLMLRRAQVLSVVVVWAVGQ